MSMHDEIYYSRALAMAVHNAIEEGRPLPLQVVTAYAQLKELYDKQIANEYGECA